MSNVKSLIVAGAGGHGRVCADVARRSGWYVSGFCDPAYSGTHEVLGVPLLEASESDLFMDWPDETALFVAIGDNTRRLALADDARRTGIPLAVLIDPSAVVSPSANVEPGALVMPNATVNAEAVIGRAALVNSAAVVEHGARVDEGAHVAPGACLTGDAVLGARSLLGARATVLPGIRVAPDAFVGAVAVVTEHVPEGAIVAGVPARPIRDKAPIRVVV
ncbi:MAG: acetyltransferase [Rhodospirillaceae bacterium]